MRNFQPFITLPRLNNRFIDPDQIKEARAALFAEETKVFQEIELLQKTDPTSSRLEELRSKTTHDLPLRRLAILMDEAAMMARDSLDRTPPTLEHLGSSCLI